MNLLKIPLYMTQLITGKRKIKISFEDVDPIKNFPQFLLESDFSIQNKNQNTFKNLIAVDGIAAAAGSSAITDFLAEFSNCTSLGGVDENENPERGQENSFEFDLFRDKSGIYELEKICYFDDNRILDGAIRDFIKLVETNYKSGISFYGKQYLHYTQEFLKKLLDFYIISEDCTNDYYVKKIDLDTYRAYAKEYINSLLLMVSSKENLVLDNLCSISNPKKDVLNQYFNNYKIVTSIRDPRDLYTTARTYPPFDIWFIPKDPHLFVKYYKWYAGRYNYKDNPNVLMIRFEEFVHNYDAVSKKIISFCGLDANEHVKKFSYFNPDVSKNNIGIYKKYKDQQAIKIIEDGLKEYLYNE